MACNCVYESTQDLQRPARQHAISGCRAGQGVDCDLSYRFSACHPISVTRKEASVRRLWRVFECPVLLVKNSRIREWNNIVSCDEGSSWAACRIDREQEVRRSIKGYVIGAFVVSKPAVRDVHRVG